ncbi:MAG TPA: AAA family ATPase [Pseudomonadales bacterium]|nr:AAA family ATPase [Pseudomonadales bacterium]
MPPAQGSSDLEPGRRLVDHLIAHPGELPFPSRGVQLVETHISWVLLCGDDVIKIKKPVHMGYIDFSTLARRDRCAREEIRLNRRLVPELYVGTLAITGTPDAPRFDGHGPLLETAVHMRQFDPAGQLDREIEAGRLSLEDIGAVARAIAEFQAQVPAAEAADAWGRFEAVMAPIRENFRRVREVAGDLESLGPRLDALEAAGEAWAEALRLRLEERRAGGYVREGHGDLHLGNIARMPWGIRAFDALEFAPELRWLDVVSDLAFLHMDLIARGETALAWRLVNDWVAVTGDHGGLRLLRFYVMYRSMVRVKVAALRRTQQAPGPERDALEADMDRFLGLAEAALAPPRAGLVLMHGLSGSGKSRVATRLADALGAIQLRSDVERKRLLDSRDPQALYGDQANAFVYQHLADTSRQLLAAGLRVIVDATFLGRAQRERFVGMARQLGVPVAIVACDADAEVLAARVTQRLALGRDASDADAEVIATQRAVREPVAVDEADRVVALDTGEDAGDELGHAGAALRMLRDLFEK